MVIQKVFITGATGFIGRHLTTRLVADGYEVGILARPKSKNTKTFDSPDVKVFPGDIRNFEEIQVAFEQFRPDTVIHLVTYYAVMHRADEIGAMLDTNVKGTVNLLEAAKESGVELFVNTSTCAVYGQKSAQLSEMDPVHPQNLYALTKLQAEEACAYYAAEFQLPAVTLRLFPPYGPGDSERRLIPYVIGSILTGSPPNLTTGKQQWDFVYVDDIVSAFAAALKAAPFEESHTVFNIGTGEPVAIRNIVETIHTLMGSSINLPWGSVPHRQNEVWYNSADISRAKARLGWSPKISTDEGLRRTIAGFREYFAGKRGV